MKPLLVLGPWGLGDAIYARPIIRDAAARRLIYLDTPWPELYSDLPIRFVRGDRQLRTQQKNLLRQPANVWSPWPPPITETVKLSYGARALSQSNVFDVMAGALPLRGRPAWDLPDMGECPIDTCGAPLALVRPVTRRSEWDNASRAPLPEYVNWVAGELKAAGYAVLVVADLDGHQEWLVGDALPPHHVALTKGEMTPRQLLATVRDAAVVVGGVGWIVPACLALGTACFTVLGGCGGMNAPARLLHPTIDAKPIGFGVPAEFCECLEMAHPCPKLIPDLPMQWERFRRRLRIGRPPLKTSSSGATGSALATTQ